MSEGPHNAWAGAGWKSFFLLFILATMPIAYFIWLNKSDQVTWVAPLAVGALAGAFVAAVATWLLNNVLQWLAARRESAPPEE